MSTTADWAKACSKRADHHEPGKPDGYVERSAWFKKMAKTHAQRRCSGCGLYVIWVPKTKCKHCGKLVINVGLHADRHHRGAR